MKYLWYIALSCLFILLVWIDLPENTPINITLGNRTLKTILNPLTIDTKVYGITIKKSFTTSYGLDLKGGSHLVFEADTTKLPAADVTDALQSSRDIIERRINYFGASEPVIQTIKSQDRYRILVELPGIKDTDKAVQLIGRTANLNFRTQLDLKIPTQIASDSGQQRVYFNPEPALKGSDIKKATVTFDQNNGKPQVALQFSPAGAKIFGDLTTKNVGKMIGIFLDDEILVAPVVQQAILTGDAVITGQRSVDETRQLAVAINSGALPVPIKLIEQRTIGPSLGAVEIQKSVVAGVIGLSAVGLFMVLNYGGLGVIACIGLLIYGLISLALFRLFSVTLTLSGIAGFILSIGMAVDSNILIFERIKEERRKGKSFETSIRLGFGRAIDAIKDANITTLLVAFILYNPLNWQIFPQLGLIKGFALTLAIGVAVSLFTGVVITRRLITILYRPEQRS